MQAANARLDSMTPGERDIENVAEGSDYIELVMLVVRRLGRY